MSKRKTVKKIAGAINAAAHDAEGLTRLAAKGGKAVAALGAAFDAYAIGSAVYNDVKNERSVGMRTVSTVGGVIGGWTGSILGAGLGSKAGTLLFPVAGTLAGGIVGGIAGGAAGSKAGARLAVLAAETVKKKLRK